MCFLSWGFIFFSHSSFPPQKTLTSCNVVDGLAGGGKSGILCRYGEPEWKSKQDKPSETKPKSPHWRCVWCDDNVWLPRCVTVAVNGSASFIWAAVKRHFAIQVPLPTHFWNSNKSPAKTLIPFGGLALTWNAKFSSKNSASLLMACWIMKWGLHTWTFYNVCLAFSS